VPGVGRQSAEQIVRVARAVVDGVARDTTVRLNPDRADRAQTELLQLMSKLRRANQLVGQRFPRKRNLLAGSQTSRSSLGRSDSLR
jgi:hypothetical protein